jgi:hypothetical protein
MLLPLSLQLLNLALFTPIVYDFYNYDMEKAEFVQLFAKFTQVMQVYCLEVCQAITILPCCPFYP